MTPRTKIAPPPTTTLGVRVTRSGRVLPFRVPEIPWWVAVPFMVTTVAVMSVVAVVAVLS